MSNRASMPTPLTPLRTDQPGSFVRKTREPPELEDPFPEVPHSEEQILETKLHVAMEATMAATVPIVFDMFQSEFNWFAREWARVPMANKMAFATKMRNQLTQMRASEAASTAHLTVHSQRTLKKQGSFAPLDSPFSVDQQKREELQLENMMVPLSSRVRWFHRSTSMANFLTPEAAADLRCTEEQIRDKVTQLSELVRSFIDPLSKPEPQTTQRLSARVVEVFRVMNKIISLSTNSADNKIVRQMSVPILEMISSAPTQGEADENIVAKLEERNNYSLVRETCAHIRANLYDKMQNLCALMVQAAHTILNVDISSKKISHADTLQLIACARA